ncbi:Proteasome subunit beta type-7 [Coemansia sp. RSA 1813]|nr:Proteasome subunit beta type-7 [Coemansia sp. RSA 1646]KAJ1772702.1 Proteasome subunit beta type-7 [Coemansia sp. RSA 1843]KAJ2090653.1 Proteasome subunit beta type-7 [Coemansia sp. RSA 986]KAJ2216143.1 Proteasome subunit beta type-7 [Coemansia sp. RSA 487]KAJ2570129.1 Proteasome subunit beta type-7 [Coemansia sp. RSA 1813]
MDPVEIRAPHTLQRPQATTNDGPVTHTISPIVTGTSVLAFKYKDGIMMAADCLGSYGSMARYRNERRLMPVGESTLVGMSGDISDYQHMKHTMENIMTQEYDMDDGQRMGTKSIYKCMSKIMYNRRCKADPLWNMYVVAGVDNGEKVLGYVDLLGTTYESSTIATGFGQHLAQPILRRRVEGREDEITEEEAVTIINDCMRVMFYRDARAFNKLTRGKITAQGVEITEPYSLETSWDFAESIVGYGA